MKSPKKKEKVGIQDIAEYLNISASTVSRALNNHPRISKETKDTVMSAAIKLGYKPAIPELMAPEKAEAVAVLLPSVNNTLYREIITGINNFFKVRNYHTFIIDTDSNEEKEHLFFETHNKYGISGVIHLISNKNTNKDFYNPLISSKLPLVTICRPNLDINVSSILPDVYQGFEKVVNFFNSGGVNSALLILENQDNPLDSQLAVSFKEAVASGSNTGLKTDIKFIEKQDYIEFGKSIKEILEDKNRPEALLVKDTLSAMEVYNIAEKSGVKIPEDILLIAIGSNYTVENLTSNLSIIKIPGNDMGTEAAELLYEQMTNPYAEKKSSIIPVNFILKTSSMRL